MARIFSIRWLAEQERCWRQIETLLARAPQGLGQLSPNELRELALHYQQALLAVTGLHSANAAPSLAPYLNNLMLRCHLQFQAHAPQQGRNPLPFFTDTFPHCVRRHWKPMLCAASAFISGTIVAVFTIHGHPQTETYFLSPGIIAQLDRGQLWVDAAQANPAASSFLMTNNTRVAFNAFAMGPVFGVGSLLLLFHNGLFAFGGPLQVCMEHGMGNRLLFFMLPHGVIELSTLFIAGGSGLHIGQTLLFPGLRPRWQAVRQEAREALILVAGCVPLLILAGLIEGLVSLNASVNDATRLIVALASALFLLSYLGLSGRENRE